MALEARLGLVRMSAVQDLLAGWLGEAETVERCGHEPTGKLIRRLAAEMEEALKDDRDETLTIAEAALESDYSSEHLRKLVASGTIPNAGEKGRPRIRRRDLPARPATGNRQIGSPEDDARGFLRERAGGVGEHAEQSKKDGKVRAGNG